MSALNAADAAHDVLHGDQSWRKDIHLRWADWLDRRADAAQDPRLAETLRNTAISARTGEARLRDPVEMELVLRAAAR